ncbi:MAG: methyltransferase domain-containing protein [Microcystis aeruginosa Ma_AC_P_19900807_S299]|jgi:2-polyprenyl-3-methyl-5-hydroxy-6-metoxy-1,4-benzoquinol methylase|uniref:Methyltransferase domain-containing protein n=1 Tax=Microcystis aeruginosa Ma_SC_T_19800800_S464 TaxID=2486257 RepID=A0A552E471_MICAE|nr:MAG: methyltransferase domain-containing protein [Microcystis aeruginosa Ma_AC_P_19900807_S299]TRU29280.1 MAG: methyltransferase domain-containing protein [Microcystis aeruginosa Ma_SC_T_19800800_S464]
MEPENQKVGTSGQQDSPELEFTGERHIMAATGVDLSWGNIEHLVRYGFVCPFIQGKKVLDITCGSGYGSHFMALQGAERVVGVDIDRQAIEHALQFHAHPAIEYIIADAQSVPELADHSFDVIVSFETIEHLPHPKVFLSEIRRLLKPGGQIFMSCPNDYRVTPWISEFHLHKFRFNEFRDLFLSIFGEGVFFGQHTVLGSCLLLPVRLGGKSALFDSYKQPLPDNFFEREYIEDVSSIENADGYFVVAGIEPDRLGNSVAFSQTPMRSIMLALGSMEQIRSDLENSQSELSLAHRNLDNTSDQLEQSTAELNESRSQLEATRTELNESRSHLEQSTAELNYSQSQLEATKAELYRNQVRTEQLQAELLDLKNSHEHYQEHLSQAQERIEAMESSKFWKLRKSWFQFKRTLGLGNKE